MYNIAILLLYNLMYSLIYGAFASVGALIGSNFGRKFILIFSLLGICIAYFIIPNTAFHPNLYTYYLIHHIV